LAKARAWGRGQRVGAPTGGELARGGVEAVLQRAHLRSEGGARVRLAAALHLELRELARRARRARAARRPIAPRDRCARPKATLHTPAA
jgi:hypothetical protein